MSDQLIRMEHTDGGQRPYIAATIHNGVVYPCGQVPVDSSGMTPDELSEQVRLCIDNLERVLVSAGSSLDSLLQLTVYLADIGDLDEYNQAYLGRMAGKTLPPRTTVQAAAFRGAKRIELTATAAVAGTPSTTTGVDHAS
ncbi:MAG: RidA family protein [Acidimicrobiales bacterium]